MGNWITLINKLSNSLMDLSIITNKGLEKLVYLSDSFFYTLCEQCNKIAVLALSNQHEKILFLQYVHIVTEIIDFIK